MPLEQTISNCTQPRLIISFLAVWFLSSLSIAEDVGWPLHGLTSQEQRFSPLSQINVQNVDQLGLAWSFDKHHVIEQMHEYMGW